MSVLFVDLDGFKGINDTFGHAAGDLLLKDVADRMRCCLRDGDGNADEHGGISISREEIGQPSRHSNAPARLSSDP